MNSPASIVKVGYPGGCATLNWQALKISSVASPPGTLV